jgi:hypothetical protein
LERKTAQPVVFARLVVPIPVEYQMSKRKLATASKHARSPKIAAKAQRATQANVRSPKAGLRSVAADSADSSPERRIDSKPVASLVIENPVTALQEDFKKTMTVNSLSKGFDLFSATANVRAYQVMLVEIGAS